jgi:hypothetical protein
VTHQKKKCLTAKIFVKSSNFLDFKQHGVFKSEICISSYKRPHRNDIDQSVWLFLLNRGLTAIVNKSREDDYLMEHAVMRLNESAAAPREATRLPLESAHSDIIHNAARI